MPVTAFGTAMLDAQNGGGGDVTINGHVARGYCSHFTQVRNDERILLDRHVRALRGDRARVLDMGCGIGRHVEELLRLAPNIQVTGIERCDAMRGHCEAWFPGQRFLADIGQVGADEKFDLVLLVGNGLGILGGSEEAVAVGLAGLLARLSQYGILVAESADHPDPPGFGSMRAVISHGALTDTYDWGHASAAWVQENIPPGWVVRSHPSGMPGQPGFFHEVRRAGR